MRKNGYSAAYRDFVSAHGRAKALFRIECKNYRDPPPIDQQAAVEALRGGATVLMTASIEQFLKDALEEYVFEIGRVAGSTAHPRLPSDFASLNDFQCIAETLRSRRTNIEKTAEIRRLAIQISGQSFIPESFSATQANPGPSTVKKLFRDFGISDPFSVIELHFSRHFKYPFAAGYVRTTLETLVTARNQVAHGLSGSARSRLDIKNWIAFSEAFGKSADNVLRDQARAIISAL